MRFGLKWEDLLLEGMSIVFPEVKNIQGNHLLQLHGRP